MPGGAKSGGAGPNGAEDSGAPLLPGLDVPGDGAGPEEHPGANPVLPVLLPLPLTGPLDYRSPGGDLPPGTLVTVPLGRTVSVGVVWHRQASAPAPARRGAIALKPITGVLPVPALPPGSLHFLEWVAAYTLSPPGLVLRMALPRAALEPPPPPVAGVARAAKQPEGLRLTPARARVLEQAKPGRAWAKRDLAEAAGAGASVVQGLLDAGALELVPLVAARRSPDPHFAPPVLSEAQALAATALVQAVRARSFSAHLLDGVTGSGKTEVYLEAVAACLEAGRQALLLLPEIALTAQMTERLAARFGAPPVLWHSEAGPGPRRIAWREVADGSARLVLGARSALFLPFRDLGLVVVDEEHEGAFKQEEGIRWHARDMAVVRAREAEAPVVLVSATPSLETRANAEAGRYAWHRLPTRHGAAALPRVEAIDLRTEAPPRGRFLSPLLVAEVQATLARGEQALLFLNRRGFAPLTLCRSCGHRLDCPNCTAWLVLHRARRVLLCHHCGHTAPPPETCPSCGSEGAFAPVGPGVERIAAEAAELFPDARRILLSSDTLTGPDAAERAARQVEAREVDLLIGTQVVAKGWHFPHLTLVGVVDADLGLAGGDLRAAERTIQLLHQVSGRVGRAGLPGRALLQTWLPDHPVMRAMVAADLEGFVAAELAERRAGGWPPYGRLVALIVEGPDEEAVSRTARELRDEAPGEAEAVVVLGPAPAPLAVLRGQHRQRLLLKAGKGVAVQSVVAAWLGRVSVPSKVFVAVDIDPMSFL